MNAPGHVTEQFALEECLRQGTASHFDKRMVAARAAPMNGPRDERLARAAFARNEDRGLRIGNAFDQVIKLEHPPVVADDILHAKAHVELRLEDLVLLDDAALPERAFDRHLKLVVEQGLGDEVE